MRRHHMVALFSIVCLMAMAPAWAGSDPNDAEGSRDPALFNRMPGFHIYNYEEREFDRYEFPVASGRTQAVEGRYTYVDYYANDGITLPSAIQVSRNYANAVKAIGGTAVYEFEDGGRQYLTLRVVKGDTEAWAHVEAGGNGMYTIRVIEKQAMRQDVVANADRLAGDIRSTGKVAVYGIHFDTDKAVVMPDSEPAIAEIVKLLEADRSLKLYVVGHTDNAGTFEHNLKLSQERAAAVVGVLVGKHGIAASRLVPFGVGPTAPVAANSTEEGRAKNRRVELVAQ
jgi:OOP family OmpA-OmpF porin